MTTHRYVAAFQSTTFDQVQGEWPEFSVCVAAPSAEEARVFACVRGRVDTGSRVLPELRRREREFCRRHGLPVPVKEVKP